MQIIYFRYIIISRNIKTLEISFIQLNNSHLETKRKDKKLIDTESNKKKQKGKQKTKSCLYAKINIFVKIVMTKSLSDRIALYADKNKSTGKQFLPAFIALKPDIEQALKDGWTIRQIWNILHQEEKIKCSYQWFRTLVNRLLVKTESSIRALIKESQLGMVMKDFVLILQLKKRSWSDG